MNPTVFGAVDGEGCIDIWDLTHDREVPRVHYKQPKEREGVSINKFKWNNDATIIITGDSVGEVNVYSVDKRVLFIIILFYLIYYYFLSYLGKIMISCKILNI